MEKNITITNNLANLRSKKGKAGISKAHLARMIGVSRSYITKIERGERIPSAKTLLRMAEYFECNMEEIIKPKKSNSKC